MESTPRFPQSLEIAARFPHSQQADNEADGKVENQKQVSHFSTARFSSKTQKDAPNQTGKIIVPERKNT